ncbi:hypothetical protein [Clostridium botulinum]|nr:hypothetical protein [Clostridium botulinum]
MKEGKANSKFKIGVLLGFLGVAELKKLDVLFITIKGGIGGSNFTKYILFI